MNLTGADTVIFYDSDWNPTMDAQAQERYVKCIALLKRFAHFRCHRIGQTRIISHSIEENIFKKATH